MIGKIPGLLEIRLGDCIEGTKHRTNGYTHSELESSLLLALDSRAPRT